MGGRAAACGYAYRSAGVREGQRASISWNWSYNGCEPPLTAEKSVIVAPEPSFQPPRKLWCFFILVLWYIVKMKKILCENAWQISLFGIMESFQNSYGQILNLPLPSEPSEAAEGKPCTGLLLSTVNLVTCAGLREKCSKTGCSEENILNFPKATLKSKNKQVRLIPVAAYT